MNEQEYDKYYHHFKQTGEFNSNIIREYLHEIGKDFDLNQFFQALNIINSPFSMMDENLQKYSGIDYQQIMVEKCFQHFDKKFSKQRYDLTFDKITDKRLMKNLLQKYPNQIIYF